MSYDHIVGVYILLGGREQVFIVWTSVIHFHYCVIHNLLGVHITHNVLRHPIVEGTAHEPILYYLVAI